MGRRINVADRIFAFEFDATGHSTDLRDLPAGPERIAVSDCARLRFEYLRVFQFEFLVGVRRNRKDARLKQILARVFQQPGSRWRLTISS